VPCEDPPDTPVTTGVGHRSPRRQKDEARPVSVIILASSELPET
jgi:hypothetical protein